MPDQQPSGFVPDGFQPDAPSVVAAQPEMRMPAGVPARGRGTQLDPDKSWRGVELATTPLAHPTGVDALDSFTSPLGIASVAAGGAGIARAGLTEGVAAAVKAAAGEASPVLKYEVSRRIIAAPLQAMGVPGADGIASGIAMVIAGYKKGAKAAEGVPPPADMERVVSKADRPGGVAIQGVQRPPGATYANPTGAPLAEPIASSPVASGPPVPAGGPESVPPPSAGMQSPQNALPDQRALNEEALARRRAEYQARVQAEAKGQPQAPDRPKLNVQEAKEYFRMRQDGKTHAQAMEAIDAGRAFQARFGTPSPTAAETRFPKGLRDYKTQP